MAFIGDKARGWFKELLDAGLVPAETVRMVVDIGLDDVVKVYYETFADEAIFKVGLLDRGEVEVLTVTETLERQAKDMLRKEVAAYEAAGATMVDDVHSHSDLACDLDAAK